MKALNVHHDGLLVGKLSQTEKDELNFQYDAQWLRSGFAISLSLPFQEAPFGDREARPFFANMLPDEGVRFRVARKLGISEKNDYALLEAIGGECAGALSVTDGGPPGRTAARYERLSESELAALVQSLPQRPLLAGEKDVRLSLAGAQDKLPVFYDDKAVSLPVNGAPSNYILKTPIPEYAETVPNEVFSMKLAKAMGLTVPEVSIHLCGDTPLCMVQRFDRKTNGITVERLHQEDFCQALGVMPSMKYEAEGGPGFADCFQLVRQQFGVPAKALKQLLRWTVFNYLLGNADAHAKNISLLHIGKAPGLAPFYDLMSTQVYGKQLTDKMAMKIGNERRLDWIMSRHWQGYAEAVGLRPAMVLDELHKMAKIMPGKARQLLGRFEKEYGPNEVCQQIVELVRKRAKTVDIRMQSELGMGG